MKSCQFRFPLLKMKASPLLPYCPSLAKRRLSKCVITLVVVFGLFNILGSIILINLVIINPPPLPFKCDPPSIRARGSRQEVCIHPDSVWKRTYSCVPFGLWRRSGYPTGDSGERDELKAAEKLFGNFQDDYLRCVIEAKLQNDSNARLLEYESTVLVKPFVDGSILK